MSSSQQNAPSTSTSPEASHNKDSHSHLQSPDVDMEAPDSPPETSHAGSSSQIPRTPMQANTSGSRVNGEAGGSSSSSSSSNAKANFGAPGSSWMTKKFNEEYEKAEASLLDRGWENKYGDPLYNNSPQ